MANIDIDPHPRSRYYAKETKLADSKRELSVRRQAANGKLLPMDKRGKWNRRWRDIVQRHVADLGGVDLLSEAQASMIRRAASMQVMLESMEGKMSAGEEVNLALYNQTSGELRRLFETVGILRIPRAVGNGSEIEEYFAPRRPTTDRKRKAHRP